MTRHPGDARPRSGWIVGVDVGGGCVAAAVRGPDGRVEPLEIEGRATLPAGVWVGSDGTIAVGTAALRQGLLSPQRWVPSPLLDLGADDPDPRVDPVAAVAALLTEVRFAALARSAPDPDVVLVCPTGWPPARRAALREAATRAGLASIQLVDGALAAALHLRTTGLLPERGRIAVCDVGASGVTSSVLDVDGPRVAVMAAVRSEGSGGDRLDELIFEQVVGHVLGLRDPGLGQNLTAPPDGRWRRMRESLLREIRRAREELSRYGAVEVHPEAADDIFLELTRYDFDNLVRPEVGRVVEELRNCVALSGLTIGELHGVQLLGGVGRTPLLARRLVTALAHSPWLVSEPQHALALGAVRRFEDAEFVSWPGGPEDEVPEPEPGESLRTAAAVAFEPAVEPVQGPSEVEPLVEPAEAGQMADDERDPSEPAAGAEPAAAAAATVPVPVTPLAEAAPAPEPDPEPEPAAGIEPEPAPEEPEPPAASPVPPSPRRPDPDTTPSGPLAPGAPTVPVPTSGPVAGPGEGSPGEATVPVAARQATAVRTPPPGVPEPPAVATISPSRLGWGGVVVGVAVLVLVAVALLVGLTGRGDATGAGPAAAPSPTRAPTRWDSWGPDTDLARTWQAVVPTSAGVKGSKGQTCEAADGQGDSAVGKVVCDFPNGVELSILRFGSPAQRQAAQDRIGADEKLKGVRWSESDLEGRDVNGMLYSATDRAYRWWTFDTDPDYAMSAEWPGKKADQLGTWWNGIAPFT